MVYFCASSRSEVFQKNHSELGVGRRQFITQVTWTAKGEGLVGIQPYHFYCLDLFSRLQLAHKWKINGETLDLKVYLYWPDFFSPTTLKWFPQSLEEGGTLGNKRTLSRIASSS